MNKQQLNEYKNWVIYQIYPKSFSDSNNDGIGDIKGIISKLDYIKSLSVDAIWICPCFPSPNADNGYDVSDYCDISPEYGTLSDMEELIEKAHKLNIKIILDLVANHTSSAHKWFIESKKGKDNPYSDFYYWADKPLNDWVAFFTGKSAWIYEEERKQYYLAEFTPAQPDLNWTNPQVRKAVCDVVDFWVKKGVDGFRCDVLDMISKDLDNPFGFGNGPKLHEYINELFGRPVTRNVFTVGECWSSNVENIKLFCGLDRNELCCSFQNDHRDFGCDKKDPFIKAPFNYSDIADTLSKWQELSISNDLLYTLFWENHDSPRIINKLGDINKPFESGTMLSTMIYLLCGVCFVYEGQELGLVNNTFDRLEDFDDVMSKTYYNMMKNSVPEKEIFDRLNFNARDNSRCMIPWTDKKIKSWIVSENKQLSYNVEKQEKDKGSYLNYFRKLLALKKQFKALSVGGFKNISKDKNAFIYERSNNEEKITVICNFDKENQIEGFNGEILLSNTNRDKVNGKFAPFECLVIKNK